MPTLRIYRSNRLEKLADCLGALLDEPLADPLEAEMIVVQSLGMHRWLALTLAARLGIAMNCEFPFPAHFAQRVFRAAFGDEVPRESPYTGDLLSWRVMAALPAILSREDCEPLRRYIGGEFGALKHFQLARQLAAVFDRHLVHRTGRLLAWQDAKGEPADWQAALWRELTREEGKTHPPALLRRLIRRIERGETALPGLPPRIAVFGISHLPPFFLDLIDAVACCADVHLFLLEPTDAYWGDIQSPREQQRILRREAQRGLSAEDLHLDVGNPLLASLGKPGRAFTRAVQDLDPNGFEEHFEPPGRRTLLESVQADIYDLRARRQFSSSASDPRGEGKADEADAESDNALPTPVAAGDSSIQIHCCHGPMRELEVLHDRLLDFFERLPGLTPKDVVVTMPDVETYAPMIEAVFGAPDDERQRIPFTIADQSARARSDVARAFLQILDLHGSRFGAATVLALLESEPLRRRFGIGEGDLGTIRGWIEETCIRWGIDGAHRTGFGIPSFEQNSWRAGLDRLLLGYALPGDGCQLFEGLLPVSDIEGGLALLLGRVIEFFDKLFTLIPALKDPRPLDAWERALRQLLDAFFDESDEAGDEIIAMRETIAALRERASIHPGPVTFEVVRAHVAHAFSDTDTSGGFLSGRVTFCSLKPMRSIPFRIICMLGLNDTAFPRRDPAPVFDQLGGDTAPAERSRRDDDRQLFLESILSARDALHLSYCGRSLRDQAESPPSVVVCELLDYLEENFVLPDDRSLREHLTTHHRLQAFSPAYFTGEDSRLFSYSAENCRRRTHGHEPPAPFFDAPLPEPDEPAWREVDLGRLATFLCHPARFFARERLGLWLPEETAPLDECEPLDLTALEETSLSAELLRRALAELPPGGALEIARATGRLPAGWSGDGQHRELAAKVAELNRAMRAVLSTPKLDPLRIDLTVGPWRLSGTLDSLHAAAALRPRAARMKAKDRIRAWIAHLALNAAAPAGHPRITRVFGFREELQLGPVADAPAELARLLALYACGQREPLRFFPEASWEYARLQWDAAPDPNKPPLDAARRVWEGRNDRHAARAESADEFNALCFRGCADPLDKAWMENTRIVFEPMLTARIPAEAPVKARRSK